jgi:hypothetical protein
MTYQLPHSAMTLTLGRSVGSKARNCNSDLERTCAKVCRTVRLGCSLVGYILRFLLIMITLASIIQTTSPLASEGSAASL